MTKKKTTEFDLIVIGTGSAGFSAADRAHSLGASVCVIEQETWGGECPWYACVPTKALLKSAKTYYAAKNHLSDYGVHASSVTYNFSEIMRRKQDVVDTITGEGKRIKEYAKKSGMTTVEGTASFIDKNTVQVGSKIYKGKKFVIATGTIDFIPPVEGIEKSGYLTYRDVVQLKRKPESIVVVGGGPVGCEFATFFAMLGTKVTLLQLASTVLHREDAEVSAIAEKQLREIGINIYTNTKALAIEKSGSKRRVIFQEGKKKRQYVTVDKIILAVGKRANVMDLGLENAGVKLDDKGRLIIKETLQTSQSHIFAAGDVSGGMLFTHTAHEEGDIAGFNAVQKSSKSFQKRDMRVVPRVTFVSPEVASVGVTPEEATASGKKILVGRFPVGALGRAVTERRRTGIVKIVVDAKTRKILGGHIVADRAGEMIHEIALAMYGNLTVDEVADMIHAYPTYSEAVVAAAATV